MTSRVEERSALDWIGWFDRADVLYSTLLNKKQKEFKIRYTKKTPEGDQWVDVVYMESSGGTSVVSVERRQDGRRFTQP